MTDPIRLQIMWGRLLSIVEEQAQALVRTAFSTSAREAGDISAGIFDTAGNMMAQAVTGTPGHVNAMVRSVKHFLEVFPHDVQADGDVYFTNDPWHGTGHLHDFTFVTPVFLHSRIIGYFASTSHVVDVGGRGMGPDANQVYEEGICIPPMRFAAAGRVDQPVIDIIRANVREPVQVIGDLYALAACNNVGKTRLLQMASEFGIVDLTALAEYIFARSREAMLAAIAKLPKGTSSYGMTVDGYEKPISLQAAITIHDAGIVADFAGTTAPSDFGINVPYCYTEAYASFGIRCVIAPDIPNNSGSLSAIEVRVPPDCILNAQRPAPVSTRHVIGQLLPDVMFGCLANAGLPVPAEGASCLWIILAAGRHADGTFNIMSFHAGGTGARPGLDGLSATAFPSGVRNVPVEVTEAISPLLFKRKEYRMDSGGAGQFRGGLGQVIEFGTVDASPFVLSANYDRLVYAARGRNGGLDGALGAVRLSCGDRLKGKGQQMIPAGQTCILELPGGGGWGDPRKRPSEKMLEDLAEGLVSHDMAHAQYGWTEGR